MYILYINGQYSISESLPEIEQASFFYKELADGDSDFVPRYKLVEGVLVDAFPGKTDNEVVAALETELKSTEVLSNAVKLVSPVEFKLLFTPQERIAIKAVRQTDPVIDDFYDIAEDPRLTGVDLTLSTAKGAIAYMVSLNLLTEARAAQILSGIPPA